MRTMSPAARRANMPHTHHRGTTLLELLTALAIVAIRVAISLPRVADRPDRIAVRHAARLIADALATARSEAMATSEPVAIHLDAPRAALTVHAGNDTLTSLMLGESHRVAVRGSRDSMSYTPAGLGLGAANLTVTVARGMAAETVTVSRLGRVRW